MQDGQDRQPDPNDPNRPPPGGTWAALAIWVVSIIALIAIATFYGGGSVETVSYSEIKQMIRDGAVPTATLSEEDITVETEADMPGAASSYQAVTPAQGDPELLELLEENDVEVTARRTGGTAFLLYLLPWILIIGFLVWSQRRMSEQMGGGFGDGRLGGLFSGRFSKPTEEAPGIAFDDVAGQDQAKREVTELVDFLRDPERFQRVGAEVPHGVLLTGPPGTGKTMLAKALAGEAEVPFFSTSGSEFIQVYVGVGAGRVRKMFEAARKAQPAVIFIDELDSIGRTRGTGLGGGHDEREQTLNQILAELDGFGGKEAIVVLAATNRPDVLDPALLRPGRFDRHVTLNLPDKPARRAILDIHARNLPLDDADDLDTIAAGTPGFSGADLKNLLNEAAINAARRRARTVTSDDLQEARDKVMMGTVRTLAIQPKERHRLAVHEAGHTAAAYYTPQADPLYKVTIIPRGRSLGGTHMLNKEEHHTLPEDYLRAQLIIMLAGRAAEKALIGSVSSGADDDIKRATSMARSMVSRWGMAEDIGPIDLRQSQDSPFLGQSIAQPREHADETAARVDEAVMEVMKSSEAAAMEIIEDHKDAVLYLVRELEKRESLDFDEIETCLTSGGKVRPLERKEDEAPESGEANGRDGRSRN